MTSKRPFVTERNRRIVKEKSHPRIKQRAKSERLILQRNFGSRATYLSLLGRSVGAYEALLGGV